MGFLGRDDLVTRLCRRSGRWELRRRNGDIHWLHARDDRPGQFIRVRHSSGHFVLFEAELPVRFSLETTPSGLFARVLLRSHPLKWSSWRLDIRESCEGLLYLSAQLSECAMCAALLDDVCREMRDEVLAFHQELRDKFFYHPGSGMRPGGVAPMQDQIDGRYGRVAANLLADADGYRRLGREDR